MATTVARLEAVLSANTRDFDRGMQKSEGRMRKVGNAAGIAGLAIAGGLAVAAKIGFKEFIEGEKVTAQMNAVLKSTGGIAKVTEKELDKMATTMMQKTGVDDEQIKTGQNMLLTFTKIRNETGKGNKIFDQATKATLDLSVAMDKDLQSSAILVGKALQDPVRGMTALRRVGVSLTDQQAKLVEELIKGKDGGAALAAVYDGPLTAAQLKYVDAAKKGGLAIQDIANQLNINLTPAQEKAWTKMTEGGKTMEAQKIILKELTTEFGGSAEAAGTTLAGQLDIAKESFRNLMAVIVTGVMPSLVGLVKHMTTAVTWLQNNERQAKALFIGLGALATALIAARIAQLALNLAVLANPYVAAAALLAAYGFVLYKFEDLTLKAKAAVFALTSVFSPLGAMILLVRTRSNEFMDVLVAFKNRGGEMLAPVITAFRTLAGWVGKAVDGIRWLINHISDIPSLPRIPNPFGSETGKVPTGQARGLDSAISIGNAMGLTLTSRFRPGDPGDHGKGKAIDMSGSRSAMSRFASAMYGSGKDVIYGWHSFWQDNGRMIQGWLGNEGLRSDHLDHVHYSVFDKGGWLKPGLTLAYNGTGAPERVGGGNVTFNFPNYVGSRQELVGLLQNAAAEFRRRNGRSAF